MTEDNDKLLVKLRENISKLAKLYEKSMSDNSNLMEVNNKLSLEIEEKNSQIEELDSKYNTLKLAKSIAIVGSDTHDAKIKVNKILREIDKCMALLNR